MKRLNNGTSQHTYTYTYLNKKLLSQLQGVSLLDVAFFDNSVNK